MSVGTILSCALCVIGTLMAIAYPFSEKLKDCLNTPGTGSSKSSEICIACLSLPYILHIAAIFMPEITAMRYAALGLWFVCILVFIFSAVSDVKRAGLSLMVEKLPVSKKTIARFSQILLGMIYVFLFPAAWMCAYHTDRSFSYLSVILIFFVGAFFIERRRCGFLEKQEKYLGVDFDKAMQGRFLHIPGRGAGVVSNKDWFVCACNFSFFAVNRRYINSYKLKKRCLMYRQKITVHDVEGGKINVIMDYNKSTCPGIADEFERWMKYGVLREE